MGIILKRQNKKREKVKIYIGRSANLVTIETVLHVYQLVMNQPDIEINLDGIDWARLLENSKKKLLIPRTNDTIESTADQNHSRQIQNQYRTDYLTKYYKI